MAHSASQANLVYALRVVGQPASAYARCGAAEGQRPAARAIAKVKTYTFTVATMPLNSPAKSLGF